MLFWAFDSHWRIYGGIAHRQAGQMLRSEIVPKSQSYYDEVIGSVIELKVSCIRQAASRHNRPSKFGASVFDFHYFAYDLQKSKKKYNFACLKF